MSPSSTAGMPAASRPGLVAKFTVPRRTIRLPRCETRGRMDPVSGRIVEAITTFQHAGQRRHSASSPMERTILIASAALAAGLVVAAAVFGTFFFQARDAGNTVQTVGAATERFTADIAKWRLTLSRQTGVSDQQAGYAGLSQDVASLRRQLSTLGIEEANISVQPPNSYPTYHDGTITGYQVQQSLFVISPDVETLERLALDPVSLETGGASLQQSMLEYFYAELDTLKRNLLARATDDARGRAQEIAGGDVRRMISARAGVFQITEPYSTEVASYGMHSTSTRNQEITVTVHATFSVK
jgi:uncharacterized protein